MTIDRYNKMVGYVMPGMDLYDVNDKESTAFDYVLYMLNRTQSMFRWSGLPDTIPARMIELYLQINGNLAISEYKGSLYAFRGGLGGEPDEYYMPTIFTVANPALDYSANLRIGEECEVIPNDSLYIGLMPMFKRYASMMVENLLSMRVAMINSRVVDLVSATDDSTRKSAEKFFQDIEDGELGVIMSNEFLEGIRSTPYGSEGHYNTITSLIELHQYYKASWYNDLGLNANYNMKRESISRGESQLNDDALLPLVDDMLRCRKEGAERVNRLYGTEITVELASSWEDNQEEIDAEQAAIDPEDPQEPAQEEGGNNEEEQNT